MARRGKKMGKQEEIAPQDTEVNTANKEGHQREEGGKSEDINTTYWREREKKGGPVDTTKTRKEDR